VCQANPINKQDGTQAAHRANSTPAQTQRQGGRALSIPSRFARKVTVLSSTSGFRGSCVEYARCCSASGGGAPSALARGGAVAMARPAPAHGRYQGATPSPCCQGPGRSRRERAHSQLAMVSWSQGVSLPSYFPYTPCTPSTCSSARANVCDRLLLCRKPLVGLGVGLLEALSLKRKAPTFMNVTCNARP